MSRRRAALAMVTRRIRRALLAAAVIVAALLATAGSAGATPEAKWVQGYFTFDGAGVYPTADGGQPLWTGKPGRSDPHRVPPGQLLPHPLPLST